MFFPVLTCLRGRPVPPVLCQAPQQKCTDVGLSLEHCTTCNTDACATLQDYGTEATGCCVRNGGAGTLVRGGWWGTNNQEYCECLNGPPEWFVKCPQSQDPPWTEPGFPQNVHGCS